MTFDFEDFQKHIPYYLVDDPARSAFVQELREISGGARRGYYISPNKDPHFSDMLQGDGWRGFNVFSYEDGSRISVRGIVLSNTCDISPENKRDFPSKVTFAPIVKLSALRARLEDLGLNQKQIESRLDSIQSQLVSSLFYLPADGVLGEDYVAILEDLHSMPTDALLRGTEKLFTLSMAAFYLFAFKLSIHFCRLKENVRRDGDASAASSPGNSQR